MVGRISQDDEKRQQLGFSRLVRKEHRQLKSCFTKVKII